MEGGVCKPGSAGHHQKLPEIGEGFLWSHRQYNPADAMTLDFSPPGYVCLSKLPHSDLRFVERNLLQASNISINTFLALLKRQTLRPVTSPKTQQLLPPLPYQSLELSAARRLRAHEEGTEPHRLA